MASPLRYDSFDSALLSPLSGVYGVASTTVHEVLGAKQQLRIEAAARRAEQPDGEGLSRQIFERLAALPAYLSAGTLMMYLDIRSEVRTRWFVPRAWDDGKIVAVPYCEEGEIQLFRLRHFDDLATGTMGVLEPKPELRGLPDRALDPSDLDLIIAPGLAFDHRGGRLGYGKGYYDRLLHCISPSATKAAVCFECQLVADIPLLDHDIRMDMIVTEKAVYHVNGKPA